MRLKRFEIAAVFAILAAIGFTFFISRAQPELSERLIRLHVVANSDSSLDQRVKLEVRDRLLEKAETLLGGVDDRQRAAEILLSHSDDLEQAANAVCYPYGYTAAVSVDREFFSTRTYDTFSLPAGQYEALRVTLGQGEGHNWWCVIFPPLCEAAAEEDFIQAGLTPEQADWITDKSTGYKVKFKAVEIYEEIKHFLRENF